MDLVAFLERDDAAELVESVIQRILGEGGISAGIVESQPNTLIIELALGTIKARKLGKALPGFLFTQQTAEQCTHPAIAEYHARSLSYHHKQTNKSTSQHVIEVCTGAGVDAQALAQVFEQVVSYEADATVAAIARSNMRRAGIRNVQIKSEPWSSLENQKTGKPEYHTNKSTSFVIWADPSRRADGKRLRNTAQYSPPLESIINAGVQCIGIKLGPADEIRSRKPENQKTGKPEKQQIETIGYGRECREKILWIGADTVQAVTIVDKNASWTPKQIHQGESNHSVGVAQARAGVTLIEPHAAVIASGRVDDYFSEITANVIDKKIGYGLCETDPGASAFHECYTIIDVDSGVNIKRIQQRVNALHWSSRTEIKKRGWDKTTDWLWNQIEFVDSNEAGVIVVARTEGGHVTMYGKRQ